MNFEPIQDYTSEFWEGTPNILIRAWTYVKVGLAQVNEFKYVAAAIFGVYYTLKLTNYMWLVGMGLVSLPFLAMLGRWWLYKGAKTSEYVTRKKGSVLGYNDYNIQVKMVDLLESINERLNNGQLRNKKGTDTRTVRV